MEYNELIKNRRSIRDFTDQKIDPKTLEEILQDTCMAPSASNNQPWRFIVINDQALMKKISDESKKNLVHAIELDPNLSIKKYESMLRKPEFNVFYNAPCLIIIVGQTDNHFLCQDCTLAVSYLMFAATARNLGTCWIALGAQISDGSLKKEIGLPDNYSIVAPIIIGHPKRLPAVGSRSGPVILKTI